jgi:FtsP/CotA-like multicopper oxidase with cupredoxin domain
MLRSMPACWRWNRRELFVRVGGWFSAASFAFAQHHEPLPGTTVQPQGPIVGDADIRLRIGEMTLELSPRRSVKTIAYNGQVPGPLLRARVGRPLTVDVWNDTRHDELVHWHGLHIPPEVDGAREEGTPTVPPNGGHRRYSFVPRPAGTRWYHSHGMTGRDLNRSTYTGQFGMFLVESADDPGAYDQEVPILLHEWDPRFTDGGSDIEFRYYSINGKMLGAGEPIRVRQNQRVLFRMLNASATLHHRLALPGHRFYVTALDGYAVPSPREVPTISLAPGERVDAIVEMNRPGVWVLGEVDRQPREGGMGIAVEYAGEPGPARWLDAPPHTWDYSTFAADTTPLPEPDGRLSLVLKPTGDRHHWTINGKSHPRTDDIIVQSNKRYRWLLDNQSAEPHPIHLHRHSFRLVRVGEKMTTGITKDVVVVPAWQQVEIELAATEPGLSLFHCHQQFHMEMGFMAMMRYSD